MWHQLNVLSGIVDRSYVEDRDWPYSMPSPGICIEELRNTTVNFRRVSGLILTL
jgi:hypothetical protein